MSFRRLAKRAFADGRNVAATLRKYVGTEINTPEIIQAAYDVQAGTYVHFTKKNRDFVEAYSAQLAALLDKQLLPGYVLLDAGTGEMTTLVHMLSALETRLAKVYACDISERRLQVGRAYAGDHLPGKIEAFKAELSQIPMPDNSVDVVTTNHAIEPNGGREQKILAELFRIARRKLVLFEPCFEIASDEGKQRMNTHGYVRDIAGHAERLGGKLEYFAPLQTFINPLNPTACFVIVPHSG